MCLAASVECEEVLSDAALFMLVEFRAVRLYSEEERRCRGIYADYLAFFGGQNKSFLHVVRNRFKFAAASVEVVHLAGNLSVLLFDMAEHGGKLVVGVVLKRLVEVDCAKRLYDLLGQPVREDGGENERKKKYDYKRL